ncbi:hypothetical protein SBV1_870013 [Verrucomicrobia bacterium]|nr:hypothetical protein SBV1_870013 [Verrucomicrobiota bacterium]
MENHPKFKRPPFDNAFTAWKTVLAERGLPTDCLWAFDENLCFEKDPASPGGFKLGFQTQFTPPPPEAERIAYDEFGETNARLVFYRIGSAGGKSVCLLLCDDWFEPKGQADGFLRRDEWGISFRLGTPGDIEEVHERARWEQRIVRDRPLHDLDFCMSLRAIHEYLAHGRVLTAYERYALRFLHAWHRLLGHSE